MNERADTDFQSLSRDLKIPLEVVEATIQLLDEDNTTAFIARFRRDQTQGLTEPNVLAIKRRVAQLRSLQERKAIILKSIESQGNLTEALAAQINEAHSSKRLEDLYLPFKPKKQSLATVARQKGLEPLARDIFEGAASEDELAQRALEFVRVDKGLEDIDEVMKGVGHLLAEQFSENIELRTRLRKLLWKTGKLTSQLIVTPENQKRKETPSTAKGDGGSSQPASSPTGNATQAKATPTETTQTEPAQTEPTQTEPTQTEPTQTEPTQTEPTQTEPTQTEPTQTEPTQTEPTQTEPTQTEPTQTEPTQTEPTQTEPTQTEPTQTEPTQTEPTQTEPTQTEPTQTEPTQTEPTQTEPTQTEPTQTEPTQTEPTQTEPTRSETMPADSIQTDGESDKAAQAPSESLPDGPKAVTAELPKDRSVEQARLANETGAGSEGLPLQKDSGTKSESATPAAAPQPKSKRKKKKKKKTAKEASPFADYANFSEPINKVPPHRVLALNRGERAKKLRVRIVADDAAIREAAIELLVPPDHSCQLFLEKCAVDSVNRLILPSLEREIRRELSDKSERHALDVFGRNLRSLLFQPPVLGRRILAIDPGYRGCRAAVIDEFGKLLGHDVIQLVGNETRREAGLQKVVELIKGHRVDIVAIGNGSACRQAEQLVSTILQDKLPEVEVQYVIVNEAGTSAYSTSEIGREELADCEPVVRSAISIGRRLMDPMSELVKVNPANLGVGLYQHDIKAKHLSEALDDVVASCVNHVGVDVNTASPALLRYVSGLGQLTARRLYEYRVEHGPFRDRQEFRKVAGFGDQTFQQAAGFLRILEGDNPLDSTAIHPESYSAATALLEKLGFTSVDLVSGSKQADPEVASTLSQQKEISQRLEKLDKQVIAGELGVGIMLMQDIAQAIAKPLRDPREECPQPIFRKGIIKLENLEPGIQLRAQVLNVVDFGVFVDIGLGESSLIHISRLSNGFVNDPHQLFSIGDTLDVWVTEIDRERRRVTLTAVQPGSASHAGRRHHGRRKKPASGTGKPVGRKPRIAKKHTARQSGRDRPRRKPARPAPPITKAMAEGKEAMRSFSDLAQFFEKKPTDDKKE